ncbi:MAG: putative LacI family transcriptional regulator [Microbacterium sp.]|jgi:LacI family transcriptional regulator|nr:putative LacI family transcriptional regulator [Microbacterium sp.]
MVTIKDVAARAGVAPMTVSRVLNQPDAVAEPTRSRVRAAIDELHYVPNRLGQGLMRRRTMMLALVVNDITNPFAIQQVRGVTTAARQEGFTVVFAHSDARPDEEMRELRALIERRVDGIILAPVSNTPDAVNFVQATHTPIVVMDYRMPENDVDTVRCDTRSAASELTRSLIELGHRRIAMLSGPQDIVTAFDRAAGYETEMARAGLPPVISWGKYQVASGDEMATAVLLGPDRPTALVTAGNYIAIGATRAARRAGLQVPEDVSIVTFDSAQDDTSIEPFFTGAVQPIARMAETATRLLFDRVLDDYDGPPRDRVFEVEFTHHLSATSAPE